MSKKIDITPPLSIYEIFKKFNYNVGTALPEFIDNSIASFRKYQNVIKKHEKNGQMVEKTIVIILDRENKKIIVRDSAFGIEEKDFQRALRIKMPPEDTTGLNEFGMGLKTASFWFGENLEILTKSPFEKNNEFTEGAKFKLTKKQINEGKNISLAEKFNLLSSEWHLKQGTVIKISGIDRDISNSVAKKLVKIISSKYRRDILNNKISIFIYAIQNNGSILDINKWMKSGEKECLNKNEFNFLEGEKLNFDEPDILKYKENKEYKKSFNFSIEYKENIFPVKGTIFIRQKGSRSQAGIDLFRRGRIIVEKCKDFIPEQSSFEYQRINGWLDLDKFPVTNSKDKIDWDGELFEKVNEEFHKTQEVKELIKISKECRFRSENTENKIEKFFGKEKSEEIYIRDKNDKKIVLPKVKIFETKEIAEKVNIKHKESDKAYKIFTKDGPKIIYSRLITDNSQDSWIKIKEKRDTIIVSLDTNHVFFNPFNDLKTNGQFSKMFIKTLRKFSIYWAYSEQESLRLREDVETFREKLSEIIEMNSKETKNDQN